MSHLSLGIHPDMAALLLLDVSVAYFLKGFSGFGPALVFMPVASLIYSPEVALASSAFIDLFVGLALVHTFDYSRDELRLAGRLIVGMASGTILGSTFAGVLPAEALLVLIAVTVVGLGLHLALRAEGRPRVAGSSVRVYAGCFAGGATGGLVGISGPFVVAGAARLDKGSFRRVLVVVFLAEGMLKLAVYAIAGVWTARAIPLAILVSPAVVLGLVVGFRSHLHVSERRFKQTVGALLVATGATVLASLVV